MATLAEYLASQDELLQEAALALPHQFSQCSYSLGPLRQAVYLCVTCPEARGICSACSIACHTDHEQIELFPKRNFRCDCPTTSIAHACTLHKISEEPNVSNDYGQNFKGQFCRCGKAYDPKTERETMIQCLACEDWFHESCCNLRERPSSREASLEPHPEQTGTAEEGAGDDAVSEASSSGLPPPLISGSDYEAFVCGSCVLKNKTLRRWAGTPGITMVVRDNSKDTWRRLGDDLSTTSELVDVDNSFSSSVAGIKRPLSPSNLDVPEAKRARGSSPMPASPPRPCLAPKSNPFAQKILENLGASTESAIGAGDIFLSEGFRERWCRCASCLPSLEANKYLLEEEDTYEPPEDPDSGLSLEELGMRALERLPRDRAIDGIHAFNEMRDDLVKYLRPFAQEGKVVNETDVREFFASLTEAAKKGRR
ncbi:Protein mlo2 [Hypsizygus marmoreus]|uniref:Protein mlo2 n=1 Tax=Hypsizygus marmoreus TaxID=39966 RepID=A0A369JY91_HYPMA|nr:Protein mlo2 [Hypsizygus marmoreus]